MFAWIVYLLTISYPVSWCQYDISNVISGIKMSVNDDMFVSASNPFSNFAVIMHPFRNISDGGPIRCNMRYNTDDRFVHSVAVAGIAKNRTNAEHFKFVFAAEKMSTLTPYVCIGTIEKSTCISKAECTNMATEGSHQEYFLIGVDMNGTFAYGFASSFVFKLDIYTNKIISNFTTKSVWPSSGFVPHAMDVAETWAVVAGYGYKSEIKKKYAVLGCSIDLSFITNISCTPVIPETTFLVPSTVVSYNELLELSVAIRGSKVLLGVHRLSSIIVLENHNSSLRIIRTHTLAYPDASSFGRVVDWADDTTIAVLVQNAFSASWSKTQILFYNEDSVLLTTPLFTFPNSQQILGSRLSSPSFARFSITIGGNMGILTDNADILIIPVAPAGYVSTWIPTAERVFVFYFEPNPCIGGTFKSHTNLGPCQICPPGTRNPGTLAHGALACIPCSRSSSNSFCPLASLADIDLSTMPAYNQAVAYPETADTTDIDDLLMKNMFQINSDPHCLVISPLLWTLAVSGMCLFILLFMVVIKLCGCQQCIKYRKRVKNIFKHTDIIGQGEMWAGGLATLAIVVLVSFSYWFSISFIQRYPIEKVVGPAKFACDQTLINARFTTGLELLAISKIPESQLIFDLLDAQTFYLTLDLINTAFTCDSIIVQEYLISTRHVPLTINCRRSTSKATTSVTFPIPRHQTTLQMNMTGPCWIGAIRLCFRGDGQTKLTSTLRQLDSCQLFMSSNKSIGRSTFIPIVFIKNINMTRALSTSDQTLYSGLWMPTFGAVSLSNEAYYLEFGDYLRYTSSLTIIQLMLDERPFYIKNIQRPIVRTAELIFHGLLFTSLCIELFAFSFLLMKLIIIPLVQWIQRLWRKYYNFYSNTQSVSTFIETSLASNRLDKDDSIWKVEIKPTVTPETDDTSVFDQEEEQSKYAASDINLKLFPIITRF